MDTFAQQFAHKTYDSTYDELVSRRKVFFIWASRVFQVGPSVSLHLVKNGDICFLANKAWSLDCCHGNIIRGINFVSHQTNITGAKFEWHQ